MELVLTVIRLAGSLGLFLYGMRIMSEGLQKATGGRMRKFLALTTSSRPAAALTGFVMTILVQSSSATSVMMISLVNAGLMNLSQAFGVMLGANVGTTLTSWFIAILGFRMDIAVLALAAIAASLPSMFSKKTRLKDASQIFLGFGLLFIGLNFMQNSIPDLSGHLQVLSFLKRLDTPGPAMLIVCVLIGTVVTMALQASSAAIAITLTMAYQGWIGVYAATALCLGANIGTTVTSLLAALGGNTESRRTAVAIIVFNVAETLLSMLFFRPLLGLTNIIYGGDIFHASGAALRLGLPVYLALFNTLFNLIATVVFFFLARPYCALIERIVPESGEYQENTYHFTYVASRVDTPDILILAIKGEVRKLSDLALDMFRYYQETFDAGTGDVKGRMEKLRSMEEYADQMKEQLSALCVRLLQDSKTPPDADSITAMIRVMDELESCTDSTMDLAFVSDRLFFSDGALSAKARVLMAPMEALVADFLAFVQERTDGNITADEMDRAAGMEDGIDKERDRIRRTVEQNLAASERTDVRLNLHILEQARHLEHIGDYCINIAETSFRLVKHAPVLEKAN